jgi:hypothetical protein
MFTYLPYNVTALVAQPVVPSTTPWWDTVWFSDVLVAVGVIAALAIYWRQQRGSITRQRESTLAHLKGVKVAMEAWAKDYFGTSYAGTAANDRSELDFNAIMAGGYFQNFLVSTEPVASLIQPPGDAWPIASKTVQAASIALLRMGQFNQLVQQQTDFNARHAAELQGLDLGEDRKMAIAKAGRQISKNIHGAAIGDATWYERLMDALDENIRALKATVT